MQKYLSSRAVLCPCNAAYLPQLADLRHLPMSTRADPDWEAAAVVSKCRHFAGLPSCDIINRNVHVESINLR
jgi:hypothetical protein